MMRESFKVVLRKDITDLHSLCAGGQPQLSRLTKRKTHHLYDCYARQMNMFIF